MTETHSAICRICPAYCQIIAHVEDGKLTKVTGDKDDPYFQGYTCPKGRALPEQHNNPNRLLHCKVRNTDGGFDTIASETAMDEVASKLQAIIEQHGPRAVAVYGGTGQVSSPVAPSVAVSFLMGIGSPMHFTSSTIDQPGKHIAMAAHGLWNAGEVSFDSADSWIVVGANPVISKASGAPGNNPAKRLKDAQQRGMALIVIDPRQTETAKRAHIHLQAKPGEDPAVLAGLLHVIINEELHDKAFVAEDVEGFAALKEHVQPYNPDYVAERADISAEQLIEAARVYAAAVGKQGRGGAVTLGTGPNMSLHGSLSEYLGYCLMSVCGYWPREGDTVTKPNVLTPAYVAKAQARPPYKGWDYPEKMRVRNLSKTASGMPTAALADEMLLEGEGQVRALICLAGNPMMAWPDQAKTYKALQNLDLLVVLDHHMTATAELAHYVIPPKLSLETPATTQLCESNKHYGYGLGFDQPYASYAPAIVEPPEGSDVVEEWAFFYGLAQRMGLTLFVASQSGWDKFQESDPAFGLLDMENKPTTDDLHEILTSNARVPLAEVKKHRGGKIYDVQETVQPKDPGFEGKLCVGNDMMMAELDEVYRETESAEQDYPFKLICRRLNTVINSGGREIVKGSTKNYNPAFMHPADMEALGLQDGDEINISSPHNRIRGIVEADGSLRRGLVSMPHAFGGNPGTDDDKVREVGSNTGRLVSVEKRYDPLTGIPQMSNIPVRVNRC
ncbi:anaerobic selenocysteine-containing dehydrogenase [Litorivivens lipolytica]|uniref:Anaerobic selenocysteine-containing dehydrogenase n=1 Tax=Litorivivens lipolytica TaxID=1524264 RepID=A0A7W4W583_9GAMM|nr:molybdopterin-dependent oxidoreductase [Litorivivens lipolytica]MBB3047580.1 anaerobic selenocysteine-containing dehydrogenase [Litorivivens lipolytica]